MRFRRDLGFTLIEILVVLAILGILAAISYSSYSNSVQKSRRSDGKEALTSAASLQERMYIQYNQYSSDISDLGGSATRDGYYTLSVDTERMSSTPCDTGTCFTVTATAQGVQFNDVICRAFTIDNLGRRFSTDSNGDDSTGKCW